MRRKCAEILDSLALGWALAFGPVCWTLRDGLGPDAVDSRGWAAVGRFLLTFAWGPVLVVLAALCLLARWPGFGGRPSGDDD